MSKKPDTAERIARWSMCFPITLPACHEAKLAHKIRAALSRERKKERERCIRIVEEVQLRGSLEPSLNFTLDARDRIIRRIRSGQ